MQYYKGTSCYTRICRECNKEILPGVEMHNFCIAGFSIDVCHDCATLVVKKDENGERTFTISIKETYERAHIVKTLDDVMYDSDLYYLGYKYIGHLPELGIDKYSEVDSNGLWIYERLLAWEKDGTVVVASDIGNTNVNILCTIPLRVFNKGIDIYEHAEVQMCEL